MLISTAVPLYSLQDINDNRVDFKVSETELKDFALGETVNLIGRDGSTRIGGTVESIRRKAN